VSAPVLVNSGGAGAQATSTVLSVTGAAGDLVVIAATFSSIVDAASGIVATGGGQTWTVLNNQSTNSSNTRGYFTLFYTILTAGLSSASITVSTAGGSGNSYPTMAAAYVGFRGASGVSLDTNSSLPAGSSFASSADSNTLSNTCSTSEQSDFFLSFFGRVNAIFIAAPTSLLPSGSSDIFEYATSDSSTGSSVIDFIQSPSYSSPQSGITVGATDSAAARGGALITIAIVGAGPPPIYPKSVLPQINLLLAQAVDEDIIAGIRPLALRNRTIPLIGPSALVLADRVMETTNTTGTGTVICTGPVAQYQPFTVIGANNTTWYAIISGDGVNWETGIGTITQLNPSGLARTTVLSSSNGGAKISLSGISTVFCDLPAAKVQTTPSGSGGGIPTGSVGIVQSASVGVTSGTGTLTFVSSPTPGNMLLFFASTYSTYSITSPASLITMLNAVNGNERIYVFGKTVIGGDPAAWAFTNASAQVSVVGYEVSNAGRMEIGQNNALQASNPTQAPFLSPLYPNGIVFAAHSPDAGSSPVANSGWTQDAIVAQTNYALTVAHAIAGPTFRAVSTMSWTGIIQPAGLATVAISPAT
jgi:hypothetical protein